MSGRQEFRGKFASAVVFAEAVEEEAIRQIHTFLDHEAFAGSSIRIMPDVHAGAGAVIGFTSTLSDWVIPNVIGVDIGCGVAAWRIGKRKDVRLKFDRLDTAIRKNIPSGMSVRNDNHSGIEQVWEGFFAQSHGSVKDFLTSVRQVCARTGQNEQRVFRSLGTLGGGNHFIEIDVGDDDSLWLVIHSGSRNFGLSIARWHQHKAIEACGKMAGLEFLKGEEAENYYHDMEVAQRFAGLNRHLMAAIILNDFFGIEAGEIERVESVHNYINFEDRIVRKGAISARVGESVIIPWNMRDGIIIGTGKGNADWNCSAPHGAGRRLGRRAAKEKLSLDEFRRTMRGIWSSCISEDTLDESPMAYKNVNTILPALAPTVDIKITLKPVYNFKASE